MLALETAIAKITIPQADMRDPNATYHKMSLAEFGKMTPHINWTRYLQQQGAHNVTDGQRRAPAYLHGARLADRRIRPSDTGRRIFAGTLLSGAMASLSAPFRKEAFRWQQVTSGVQQAAAALEAVRERRRTARSARRSGRSG